MSKKDKLAYKGELSKCNPRQQREYFGNAVKFSLKKKYWDKTCSDVVHRMLYGHIEVHNHTNVTDFIKGFSELQSNHIIGIERHKQHIELLEDITYFNRSDSIKKVKRRTRKKHITRIMEEYSAVMRTIARQNNETDLRPEKGIIYFSTVIKNKFIDNG